MHLLPFVILVLCNQEEGFADRGVPMVRVKPDPLTDSSTRVHGRIRSAGHKRYIFFALHISVAVTPVFHPVL